jgi:hypothetical protein
MLLQQPGGVQVLAGVIARSLTDPSTAHTAPGVEGLLAEQGPACAGRRADRAQACPARSEG